MTEFLVLGAGELGSAIIDALLNHTTFSPNEQSITLMVRPATLTNSTDQTKRAYLDTLQMRGVTIVGGDLESTQQDDLATTFGQYTSIIHAGAMTQAPGTQLKITKAALAAGVHEYVPWQWGVDYDVIGPEAGAGLFSEQCEVRALLRAQSRTKWFILSCGVFMSFLFEPFWGVVRRNDAREVDAVRAFGGWDHLLTATTAEDIAKCAAELLLVDRDRRGQAVYISGQTLTYSEFADAVEKVVGRKLDRQKWSTEFLEGEYEKDPENKLRKYRIVFSRSTGLAWYNGKTYNTEKGITMEGYQSWMRHNLK